MIMSQISDASHVDGAVVRDALGDAAAPWTLICLLEEIPRLGSRVVKREAGDVAVFRTATDGVFALRDQCPHKGGPLSQGLVHGDTVTCPLHGWQLDLPTGQAKAPDEGCAHRFPAKVVEGHVYLQLG
jgi:nitrite reductase (NADH) small subunit